MSVYLAKHPEDQSKLIDENAQFLGDKNNAEAVAAAWFFSQYDLNSRRKSREGKSRMKDHVWSRKEQNSVRNKLVEIMAGVEPARCIRKLLPFCDRISEKSSRGDRRIQKQEFVQCLDPDFTKKKSISKNNYQQYFKRLHEKKN